LLPDRVLDLGILGKPVVVIAVRAKKKETPARGVSFLEIRGIEPLTHFVFIL